MTDVAIIGTGPAALYAAYYCHLHGLDSVHLFDAAAKSGGQLHYLYAEKSIYDAPGIPHILADNLASALERQLYFPPGFSFPANIHHQRHLRKVRPDTVEDVPAFRLSFSASDDDCSVFFHYARSIIYAVGVGPFVPRPTLASAETHTPQRLKPVDFAEWGLLSHAGGIAIVSASDPSTSMPGTYAIGDCATYPGKTKLLVTAFAEAHAASLRAYETVRHHKPLGGFTSTSGHLRRRLGV